MVKCSTPVRAKPFPGESTVPTDQPDEQFGADLSLPASDDVHRGIRLSADSHNGGWQRHRALEVSARNEE